MIGVKSVAAVALAALLIGFSGLRHALDPEALRHLSAGACFLVGLVVSLAAALVGVGWRFGVRSRTAVALVGGRLAIVGRAADGVQVRELPGPWQRALVMTGVAAIAISGLGNHAAARIAQLPDELAAPAPSEYCMPEPVAKPAPETAAAAPRDHRLAARGAPCAGQPARSAPPRAR